MKHTGNCGKRYIILHAGTKNGFVEGNELVFACKNSTDDFHNNMNHNLFEEWFKNLLISLEEPSVIILDHQPITRESANHVMEKGRITKFSR